MLPEEDRIRLQHMLDAARSAAHFIQGRRQEDLADRSAGSYFVAMAINCKVRSVSSVK